MAEFDMRSWALRGAEQRLLEIAEEAKAIYAAFPELRGSGRGFAATSGRKASPATPGPRRRRRRKMSAAEKKAISQRMKKYWAGRRKKR